MLISILSIVIVSIAPTYIILCVNKDVKRVRKIPYGFIRIEQVGEHYENGLRYIFWESQVSFLDADNICIYQTDLNNRDFLVKHEANYYANEIMMNLIMRNANVIFEQRNHLYKLREPIILRSTEIIQYVIIIEALEINISDNVAVCTIKYATNPTLPEHKRAKIFDHIETENGTIIDDFTLVGEDLAQAILPLDEKVKKVVLKSPDYPMCIRELINE